MPPRQEKMKANKLLARVYDDDEKLKRLVRWAGRSWNLIYKWRNDGEGGEPCCLQRTLDLIDLTYPYDPTGARLLAELPLQHFKEIQSAQAASSEPLNEFENAFNGMREAAEAAAALTDKATSLEEQEREFLDVQRWVEENLCRIRSQQDERRKHWRQRA
jgi:hypothetical protein